MLQLLFFSRSEHRQGRLCVNQLGCGISVILVVKDGFIEYLGVYQSLYQALGGSQNDPNPNSLRKASRVRFFSETKAFPAKI